MSQRLKTRKTSSRLRRPRTKKRRRPKQAAIEVIPVNEVPDVIGGDYDDYDIVDYVYEYDDVGPPPEAPIAAPQPPPPPHYTPHPLAPQPSNSFQVTTNGPPTMRPKPMRKRTAPPLMGQLMQKKTA